MDMNDFVCAAFGKILYPAEAIIVTVNFYSKDMGKRMFVCLQDKDHQSLIETLDAIWGDWTNADQDIARGV